MLPAELWLAIGLAAVAAALGYFVFASFAFGAGYQPTPRVAALEMLRRADLTAGDTLYDLGAGTGALIFRAVRLYHVRAVGVEIEPLRVFVLRLRRALSGDRERITIRWGDLFDLDFRDATVVATFLWPRAMERLRPKLESELRAGARLVSHCHPVRGWTPSAYDATTRVYLYRWPDALSGHPATDGARTRT